MERKSDKRDSLAAVLVLIGAYATAQASLIALQVSGIIGWHWAAVLTPSWIVCGIFLAVIITGTVLGLRDYKRKQRAKEQLQEAIKKSLDDFIRSLEDGEEADD